MRTIIGSSKRQTLRRRQARLEFTDKRGSDRLAYYRNKTLCVRLTPRPIAGMNWEFLAWRSLLANPHLQQRNSHIPGAPKEIISCIAIT